MEEFLEEFPTVEIDVNKTLEYSNDTDSKDRKFCLNTFCLLMINANYTIISRQQRLLIFYIWDMVRYIETYAILSCFRAFAKQWHEWNIESNANIVLSVSSQVLDFAVIFCKKFCLQIYVEDLLFPLREISNILKTHSNVILS